ncbi:putative spore protein YtfJ [Methanofollis sp. W23]|uniref:hypothetical protein n=1 Tax=Methanofollis sp. W23 TaxID=2817849 RepID=UPI001AE8B0A4|nr:hypothetical protein [Methanofollis sp. W23]MBP2146833.1 putative spore protein YtfJ [Methanofollis sp. W23]
MTEIIVGEPLRVGERVIIPLIKETTLSGTRGAFYAARPVALIVTWEESTLLFSLEAEVHLSDEIIHDATGRVSAVLKEG